MATQISIDDIVNLRAIPAAIAANPGSIAIQNILGVLKQVNDQGVATAFGGGGSGDLLAANNLSDLASIPTALTNLGVQASSAVAITGGTITGVGITASTLNMGGNSVVGGTASGGSLTLSSTAHATKGTFVFGTTACAVIDEVANQIRVGAAGAQTACLNTTHSVNGVGNTLIGYNTSAGNSASNNVTLGNSSTQTMSLVLWGGSTSTFGFMTAGSGAISHTGSGNLVIGIGTVDLVIGSTIANGTDYFHIYASKSVTIGDGTALAAGATGGDFYIPAGIVDPTGIPDRNGAGRMALRGNSVTGKVFAYSFTLAAWAALN